MGRTDNDISRLFPGVDLSRISFLPLIKEFFEGVIITDRLGCVLFVNDEQARIDRRQYQQKTFGNQPNRPVM